MEPLKIAWLAEERLEPVCAIEGVPDAVSRFLMALWVAERNAVEPVMVTTVWASALAAKAAAMESDRMRGLMDFMILEGFVVDQEVGVSMCSVVV